MFPRKTTSIAVEWRVMGFRVRTAHALFVFVGGFASAGMFALNSWLGLVSLLLTGLVALAVAGYIYRNDRELVLGEMTLLSLLWNGTRKRYSNNEAQEE